MIIGNRLLSYKLMHSNISTITRFNFHHLNKRSNITKNLITKELFRKGKRSYNSSLHDFFRKVENYMPRRSFTYTLICINFSLFMNIVYSMMKNMGMYEEMRFLNHFSLSAKNLNYNRYYTLFTAHLVDNNIYDVVLNSVILYFIGKEMERAFGNYRMFKLLAFTSIISSLVLCTRILGGGPAYFSTAYMGTHSYLRTYMYYLILAHPYNDIILFSGAPRIPFFVFGALFLFVDLIRKDYACLSGFLTSTL